jgi:O-antigen polymerase
VLKAKPWQETRPERQLAWGFLLVIGIHSMLEYPLWYGPFFMTAVICIGVLCADIWKKWLLAGTEYRKFAIVLGVRSVGVALLCATAFVAFDYHRVSQIYLQPEQRSSWYADDALGAAKQSVLFTSHAKFAELTITPLSRETAPRVLALSSELIEWSPEPRVIEKLIESSVMMGLDDVAAFHLKRYRVAYPQAYAAWAAQSQKRITSVL